ncbi:MAG: ATP-binding protein [Chloroflexota bacterium]
MTDYEKLGVFYLGREFDQNTKKMTDDLLLYDSRDLVTHAVAVGMTGSGKTGLCIDLIEEAAMDGVPSILIDPKGDLANLLLTFPDLSPAEFLPWVNPDEAARKGQTPEVFAAQQSALWQKGLADWDQGSDRIKNLLNKTDFAIYTPGSNAGLPVSILKSFAVPPFEIMDDGELLQERISTTVVSLLGLLNIEADPVKSREYILIATIFGNMWKGGIDIDLVNLINQVQNPSITKIGVLDLETYYPSKDRFELVMALNNLLASPAFSSWLEGVPLDINSILHTSSGKPRVAIFSIAHLSDNERMFFVSILLNQILGWMRTQPGTTSLRALVYMDEIFGYFPPVANPPSKKPLMTLLKQARAFGVGIVLATQNPVDLDYKGLANTGTWFIGRLQTERDKEKMMEGLEGAAASSGGKFDRQKMEQLLAGLGNRVFLMNNTHQDEPVLFQTRWSMSYLRGPLTRSQIKLLMDKYKAGNSLPEISSSSGGPVQNKISEPIPAAPVTSAGSKNPPALPPEITQFYLPIRGNKTGVIYQPRLLGYAKIHFAETKSKVDVTQDLIAHTAVLNDVVPVDWEKAETADFSANDLEKTAAVGVMFADAPGAVSNNKNFIEWNKDFISWVYGSQSYSVLVSPSLRQFSKPGEEERDFRVRLQLAAREQRDEMSDALRKKYAPKLTALQEKIRKAQQAVKVQEDQANQVKLDSALSFGASIFNAFATGKITNSRTISKAQRAFSGVSRSMKESSDVNRAGDTVEAYQNQFTELEAEFNAELASLENKIDPMTEQLESLLIKPKKTDINVQLFALVWTPFKDDGQGSLSPAW